MKIELGSKHKCQNCGTKFFDLNKAPITCPKCGTVLVSSGGASAPRAARATDDETDETEAESSTETMSLEEADTPEDGKVTTAEADEEADVESEESSSDDSDDTFLEEDEEDDGDVSDLIDGDIEDDEER